MRGQSSLSCDKNMHSDWLSRRAPFGSRASLADHLVRSLRDLVKGGTTLTICILSSQSSATHKSQTDIDNQINTYNG